MADGEIDTDSFGTSSLSPEHQQFISGHENDTFFILIVCHIYIRFADDPRQVIDAWNSLPEAVKVRRRPRVRRHVGGVLEEHV